MLCASLNKDHFSQGLFSSVILTKDYFYDTNPSWNYPKYACRILLLEKKTFSWRHNRVTFPFSGKQLKIRWERRSASHIFFPSKIKLLWKRLLNSLELCSNVKRQNVTIYPASVYQQTTGCTTDEVTLLWETFNSFDFIFQISAILVYFKYHCFRKTHHKPEAFSVKSCFSPCFYFAPEQIHKSGHILKQNPKRNQRKNSDRKLTQIICFFINF